MQTISENGAIHRKILRSLDVGVEHYRKLESGVIAAGKDADFV